MMPIVVSLVNIHPLWNICQNKYPSPALGMLDLLQTTGTSISFSVWNLDIFDKADVPNTSTCEELILSSV